MVIIFILGPICCIAQDLLPYKTFQIRINPTDSEINFLNQIESKAFSYTDSLTYYTASETSWYPLTKNEAKDYKKDVSISKNFKVFFKASEKLDVLYVYGIARESEKRGELFLPLEKYPNILSKEDYNKLSSILTISIEKELTHSIEFQETQFPINVVSCKIDSFLYESMDSYFYTYFSEEYPAYLNPKDQRTKLRYSEYENIIFNNDTIQIDSLKWVPEVYENKPVKMKFSITIIPVRENILFNPGATDAESSIFQLRVIRDHIGLVYQVNGIEKTMWYREISKNRYYKNDFFESVLELLFYQSIYKSVSK